MEDELLPAVRKVFLTANGMARIKAVAWSEDGKCLCLLGFDERWIEVWLESEDVSDDSDMTVTNNGTPAGGSAEVLWGDW